MFNFFKCNTNDGKNGNQQRKPDGCAENQKNDLPRLHFSFEVAPFLNDFYYGGFFYDL